MATRQSMQLLWLGAACCHAVPASLSYEHPCTRALSSTNTIQWHHEDGSQICSMTTPTYRSYSYVYNIRAKIPYEKTPDNCK
eukprot:scaffold152393_cov24-Prasinocladus_malaysianus.AAC.1